MTTCALVPPMPNELTPAIRGASGRAVEANLTVGAITGYLLFVLLNILAGVALGALLQSSATAIAASFALPAAFAVLGTASTL